MIFLCVSTIRYQFQKSKVILSSPALRYNGAMIRSVSGSIAVISDTSVVVSIHGIGYLVYTNALRQQFAPGDQVQFHTHLAVRENALDLYGFLSERELDFFELLLTVPKIGPKSALQVLCQADTDLLTTAILMNDAEHLHKLSGIGKKTASNIVSALSGKVDAYATTVTSDLASAAGQFTAAQADAIDALITLGYDQKEARALVLKLDAGLPTKDLIQGVLKQSPMK
jgi:holliday junction DNA helicase RuvA